MSKDSDREVAIAATVVLILVGLLSSAGIFGCTIKTEIAPPRIFKDGERPLEKLKERIDEKRTDRT